MFTEGLEPPEFEPVEASFVLVTATLDHLIRFRLMLNPYPPEDWAQRFWAEYPELPKGVDTWLRSSAIIEVDCQLDYLKNVKRRLQTWVNELNLWYEKEIYPSLMARYEERLQRAEQLDEIVDLARDILEDKLTYKPF